MIGPRDSNVRPKTYGAPCSDLDRSNLEQSIQASFWIIHISCQRRFFHKLFKFFFVMDSYWNLMQETVK